MSDVLIPQRMHIRQCRLGILGIWDSQGLEETYERLSKLEKNVKNFSLKEP